MFEVTGEGMIAKLVELFSRFVDDEFITVVVTVDSSEFEAPHEEDLYTHEAIDDVREMGTVGVVEEFMVVREHETVEDGTEFRGDVPADSTTATDGESV